MSGSRSRQTQNMYDFLSVVVAAAAVSLWIVSSRMKNDIVPIDTMAIYFTTE